MNTGYELPETLEEACLLLESDGACALAGGVAFTMALTKAQVQPSSIVSLAKLSGLRGVEAGDGLVIGALTTHVELLHNPALAAYDQLLPLMFSDVGNVRVRAVGTLGGNLAYADPRHDPAPLLSALGAEVVLRSARASRRIPLESLAAGPFQTTLEPGELLTSIELPPRPVSCRTGWCKLQSSSLDDYASVSVAVSYEDAGGRVVNPRVYVGAADTHVRPLSASDYLAGAAVDAAGQLDPEAVQTAADAIAAEVQPKDDHRGSPRYKRQLTRAAFLRAVARTGRPSERENP